MKANANPSMYMILQLGINVLSKTGTYGTMKNKYVFFFSLFSNLIMNQVDL